MATSTGNLQAFTQARWGDPAARGRAADVYNRSVLDDIELSDPRILDSGLLLWAWPKDQRVDAIEALHRTAIQHKAVELFGVMIQANLIEALDTGELDFWRDVVKWMKSEPMVRIDLIFYAFPIHFPSSMRQLTADDLDFLEETVFGTVPLAWDPVVLSPRYFASPEVMVRFVQGCRNEVTLSIADSRIADSALLDLCLLLESPAAPADLVDPQFRNLALVRALVAMLDPCPDPYAPLPVPAALLVEKIGMKRSLVALSEHSTHLPLRKRCAVRVASHFAMLEGFTVDELVIGIDFDAGLVIAEMLMDLSDSEPRHIEYWYEVFECDVSEYLR